MKLCTVFCNICKDERLMTFVHYKSTPVDHKEGSVIQQKQWPEPYILEKKSKWPEQWSHIVILVS